MNPVDHPHGGQKIDVGRKEHWSSFHKDAKCKFLKIDLFLIEKYNCKFVIIQY